MVAASYILSVDRLESVKRVDLAIRAFHVPPSLSRTGTGTHANESRALATRWPASRSAFLGSHRRRPRYLYLETRRVSRR